MPLLGTTKWVEYEVTLQEGEELNTWYLLAPSSEEAAWSALELSTDRNAILKNITRTNEWQKVFPKQLAKVQGRT